VVTACDRDALLCCVEGVVELFVAEDGLGSFVRCWCAACAVVLSDVMERGDCRDDDQDHEQDSHRDSWTSVAADDVVMCIRKDMKLDIRRGHGTMGISSRFCKLEEGAT